MIKPFTFICFVTALGSGLYLYQSKHTAQMLDHTIEKTARDTDAVREQTRALRTEWTLLNEPDRLRQLAEQYLPTLKPLAPTQFTTLADLNGRLPAPQAIAPEPAPVVEAPAVAAADDASHAGSVVADASQSGAADVMPVPPIPPPAFVTAPSAASQVAAIQPAPAPTSSPLTHIADRKPAAPATRQIVLASPPPRVSPSEPRTFESRTFEPRAPEPRPAETRTAEARPVELRGPEQPRLSDYRILTAPRPARPAPFQPSGGGSMLGMARGPDNLRPPLPMPMPRPTPVNAFSSSWPNGG
jgi:hypothetical protein